MWACLAFVDSTEVSFRLNDHWIGLRRGDDMSCTCTDPAQNCTACQQTWVWDDGVPMTYNAWRNSLVPDPGREACGRLNALGWADMRCDFLFYYICEVYVG